MFTATKVLAICVLLFVMAAIGANLYAYFMYSSGVANVVDATLSVVVHLAAAVTTGYAVYVVTKWAPK